MFFLMRCAIQDEKALIPRNQQEQAARLPGAEVEVAPFY